jgi:hypothetical protein
VRACASSNMAALSFTRRAALSRSCVASFKAST